MTDDPVGAAPTPAFADEWGRVVASLVRTTGDWALAEDAEQEAFAAAAATWPRDGVPGRQGAELTTVARNRALDRIRRGATERSVLAGLQEGGGPMPSPSLEPDDVPDDRPRLTFTCCHPALSLETRVALTLRTLCGLTVEEIAHAFDATEAATANRNGAAVRDRTVASSTPRGDAAQHETLLLSHRTPPGRL